MVRACYSNLSVIESPDPCQLPNTGVLWIKEDGHPAVSNADWYYKDLEYDVWSLGQNPSTVLDHHFKGDPVFQGAMVSKETWKAAWDKLNEYLR